MSDKEIVLPLATTSSDDIDDPDFCEECEGMNDKCHMAGQRAQRNADWQRVQGLVEAAQRFFRKFHVETDCGQAEHWAECEAMEEALALLDREEKP